MAEKPTIPDFPNLPDFGQMITQACELVASVRGIPYDFNGTLSLENKFVILFKTVKEMFEAQTSLIKSYKDLYEFIKSYFDNLDVQEEINKKINQMVIDDTLLPIMSPAISSETTKWLSTNITNPSNPPIDKSLTVTGAAADARTCGDYSYLFAVSSNFSSFSVPFTHDDKSITFTVNCSDGYLFTMHNYFYAKDLNGRSGTYTYKKPFAGDTFVVTFRPSDTSVHVYQINEFIPITDVIIYSIALHRDFTVITEVFSVFNTYDSTLTSTNNAANARIAGNFANKFAVSSNFSSFSVPFTHDDKSITFTVNCSDGYLFTMHNYFPATALNGRSGTYTYETPFAGDTFVVTFRPSDTSVHVYQISEFIPITDVIIYSIALHRDFTVITEVFSVFKEKTTVHLSTNNLGDNTFSIFNKVICCGDSYTSGYIKTSSSRTETNEKYSWVKYISSITGNKFINCGSSGANVLTWQSAERGLLKAKSSGVSQCYTIGLGLNDSSNTESHVDIGTTNDIGTDNKTYYGGYSKIIRELHAISPKSFIFCFTMPFENDSNAPYNEAIVNICNSYKSTYKTYLVDLRKYTNYYTFSTVTNNAVGGHYSPAGYQQMAEIACKAISDCINKNYIDFYDVNLIPYDE